MTTKPAEVFEFKAETRQLLGLVIHSLYTQKEIFLRELISNASDAIDRLRFEAMIDPRLADSEPPAIRVVPDPANRTLSIHDTGIGMTRDEVIANIGTIAHSGTQALLDEFARHGHDRLPALIGRFGVGFYSAFMVADRVSIVTRRAGEATATCWESAGDGQFAVSEAARATCGTSITLTLKPVDHEAGLDDYTDPFVLSQIVRRHSDFVAHPIVLESGRVEEAGAAPAGGDQEPATITIDKKTLNSQTPIWSRPPGEASDQELNEFYRAVEHDWSDPLLRLTARAEGRIECQVLVFVPAEAPPDLYYHTASYGLRLYAKRVLVIDRCAEVIPPYLRFVRGVVDVLDLPLNISRQTLQDGRHVADIRRWLTRRLLDLLDGTRRQDAEKYLTFWRRFGRALKEGLDSDPENRDRLLSLFLFESSHHATDLTTLAAYIERMPPDQNEIYYLTGDSRDALEHAPHVEAARARGCEVLYLVDPVDDVLVRALPEHGGKRLRSLANGIPEWESGSDADARAAAAREFTPLLQRLEDCLKSHVKRARLSTRLTSSPACLTGEELDLSPRMERLLHGRHGRRQRRILELNPQHPVVTSLKDRIARDADDARLPDYAELLIGYALLAEGSEPADPVRFTRALAHLMEESLGQPGAGA